MADRRKLQGEIDRCLKKVTEGVEIFEDIWQKVHAATNANQKEKYETDLKKEIKKLQRLRDQIKTWTSSSDIKDKRVLQENRKLIETQMERFKVVERETKTKAYSKEGLSGAIQKTDPAQKEREEIRHWVTGSIGTLNLQVEQFESEIETLILTSKKKKLEKDKQDRVDQVRKYMEKHKYHVKQLETLLRMLDNNNIETESIRNIKDDIEYYIESSQDPDFKENEYIYEDLNLDEMNEDLSLSNSTSPSTTCSSPTPSSPPTVQNYSKSFGHDDDKAKSPATKNRGDEEARFSFDTSATLPNNFSTDDGYDYHCPFNSLTTDHTSFGHKQATSLASTPKSSASHFDGGGGNSSHSSRRSPIVASRLFSLLETSPPARSAMLPKHAHNSDPSSSSLSNSSTTAPPISYAAVAGHFTSSTSNPSSSMLQYHHYPPRSDHAPPGTTAFHSSFTPLMNVPTPPNMSSGLTGRVLDYGSAQQNYSGDAYNNATPQTAADSLKSIASQIVMAGTSHHSPQSTIEGVAGVSKESPRTAFRSTDIIQEQQSRRLSILRRLLHQQGGPAENGGNGQNAASSEISSYIDNLKVILSSSSAAADTEGTVDCDDDIKGAGAPDDPQETADGSKAQPPPASQQIPVESVYRQPLDYGASHLMGNDVHSMPPVTDNKKFIEEVLSRMVVSGHGVEQALKANTAVDLLSPRAGGRGPTRSTTTVSDGGGPKGEAVITPLLAAAPLGPIPLGVKDSWRAQLVDRVYGSETAIPKCMDGEKTRWLLNRTPYTTPAYYNNPAYSIDAPDFFQKLSTETLFFIFYYFEGSKAQYLAAKALKKLSWRFHTKYLMWFQRHEEPKTITDEYEQGTYIYFDYEKWSQRRKEGFTFEYKFLEDRDLS